MAGRNECASFASLFEKRNLDYSSIGRIPMDTSTKDGGGFIKGALDRISPKKEKKKARKGKKQSTAAGGQPLTTQGSETLPSSSSGHRTFLGGALKNAADKVAQGSQDALRAVAAGTHKATNVLTSGGTRGSNEEDGMAAEPAAGTATAPLPLPHLEAATSNDETTTETPTVQTKESQDETVDTMSEPKIHASTSDSVPASSNHGTVNAERLVIVGLAVGEDEEGGDDAPSPTSSGGVRALVSGAENVLHKAVIKPIIETSKGVVSTVAQGSGDFVNVVQPITRDLPQLKERITKRKPQSEASNDTAGEELVDASVADDTPALPPDDTLQGMELLFDQRLRGVSIREWYETCWSEGNRTDRPPFYGPWLASSGKKDVVVGEWEYAGDDAGASKDGSSALPLTFVNAWDQQEYQQRRTVSFRSDTNSANVTHTQYCRVEKGQNGTDGDRCVVAFVVTMKGIPFADAFSVNIRWVATRTVANSLLVQVGLFVAFAKQVLVAGQIRSNTTKQTTLAQKDLFRAMRQTLGCQEEEAETQAAPVSLGQTTAAGPSGWLEHIRNLFRLCFPNAPKERRGAALQLSKLRALLQKIQRLDPPSECRDSMYVLAELEAAHAALTSLLVGLVQGESAILTTPPAPEDAPRSPTLPMLRNPLQVLVLDPIQKVIHLAGGGAPTTSDEATVATAESTEAPVRSPAASGDRQESSNDFLSLVEDCLHRCWTSGSAWVDHDAELGRHVRWLDAKVRAAELLVLEADEAASDGLASHLDVASESLIHIIDWHQAQD